MKFYRFSFMILILITLGMVCQTNFNIDVNAATYTTYKTSSGGSLYTLYLDLTTTSWRRGETIYFDIGLTVNSFGSGIYDFHEINLWVLFDDGDSYSVSGESEWGSVTYEGGTYESHWSFTPSQATPSLFYLYIGSDFWEDVGWGDPYTDDGWTYMVTIYVSDPPPPSITHPNDKTFSEGVTGNEITWVATHDSPDDYYIYQDGSLVESGYWSSGISIAYTIDYLLKGDYTFTIYVWDDFSQSTSDSVNVHVLDTTSPIIDSPVDLAFEENMTGKFIEWTAYDTYPESYELTRNGDVIESGAWTNLTPLIFTLNSLKPGTYTYCLTVVDESGNSASDCVQVEVIATAKTENTLIFISILALISIFAVSSVSKRK